MDETVLGITIMSAHASPDEVYGTLAQSDEGQLRVGPTQVMPSSEALSMSSREGKSSTKMEAQDWHGEPCSGCVVA